jgi:hypothetical protein
MWNIVLTVNSVLCAAAVFFTVYGAGASIYYLTLRPLELGIILVLILICTEVIFAALEESFD